MSSKYINEMQIFGKQLKILIQEVGIKQKELAELAEMNDSNISRLAGGTSTPTLKFILLLADTYKVSLNWLLLGICPMLIEDISPRFGVNSESTTNHPTAEFNHPIPAARTIQII